MADRRMVRIELFDWDGWNIDRIDNFLSEFIAVLSDILNEVPPEWRGSVRICGQSDYWGDGGSVSLSAFYDRPETDAELAEREAREAAMTAERAARQRVRELEALRALQAKYGAA